MVTWKNPHNRARPVMRATIFISFYIKELVISIYPERLAPKGVMDVHMSCPQGGLQNRDIFRRDRGRGVNVFGHLKLKKIENTYFLFSCRMGSVAGCFLQFNRFLTI